jgi:hypothetical protein
LTSASLDEFPQFGINLAQRGASEQKNRHDER